MNIREAYKVMQAASGIKEGDKVKVIRSAEQGEMGWYDGLDYSTRLHDAIGQTFIVTCVTREWIRLKCALYAPFFALAVVEKAPISHTITIDGKDIEISDESYENLKKSLK